MYHENECLPATDVLERTEARLGEKHYCLFTNNCEHFANECKTGEKKCHQIWTSIEILGKNAISSITSFLNSAIKWCRMVVRSENSWVRQPGVAEVAEHCVKFGTGLSIFIVFIVEVVILGKITGCCLEYSKTSQLSVDQSFIL